MSEMQNRPPGLSTRAIARKAGPLSGKRFSTQTAADMFRGFDRVHESFEMTGATLVANSKGSLAASFLLPEHLAVGAAFPP